MTILLTGGAGYIGSHAAAVLLASGQPVVILDNLSNSNSNRDVLERLERLSGMPVPFVEAYRSKRCLRTSAYPIRRGELLACAIQAREGPWHRIDR